MPPRPASRPAPRQAAARTLPPAPAAAAFDRWARLAARVAFAATLLMACASWCQGFYRHFAHAKSFAMWMLLAFGVPAAIAAWRPGRPRHAEDERELRRFRAAVLLVGLTWFWSLAFAVNIGHGLEDMTRIAPILIVAWWASQRPLSWRRDVPWAVGLMCAATVIILFLGLMQWQTFQDWVAPPPRDPRLDPRAAAFRQEWIEFLRVVGFLTHDRWLATLGNANSAASYYALALGLMGGVLAADRTVGRRLLAGVLFIALIIVLLLTKSRGGIVAGGAALAAVLVVWTQCPSVVLPARPWQVPMRVARALGGVGAVVGALAASVLLVAVFWLNHDPRGRLAGTIFLLALGMGVVAAACIFAGSLIRALARAPGQIQTPGALDALGDTVHNLWNGTAGVINRVKRSIHAPVRWIVSGIAAAVLLTWVIWLAQLTTLDAAGLKRQDEVLFNFWRGHVRPSDRKHFLDRMYIWQSGAQMLRDYPLGLGWGQFPLIYPLYTQLEYYDLWSPESLITTEEAHSGHLNLALETGVPGTLAWAALFILAWMGAMRRMRWAASGDAASRAALMWFPVGVTMAVHMGIDKFWAYPASLTALMWCLGTMVRPRAMVATAPAPAPLVVMRRHAIGLGLAVLASASALHIAAASHYLTRSRMAVDETESRLAYLPYLSSAGQRASMAGDIRDGIEQAARWLELARVYSPWEIDAWSRSLDSQRAIAEAVDAEILPESRLHTIALDGETTVGWLVSSVRISPNYYPVQRNLGQALLAMAERTASPEAQTALPRLAIKFFDQVLSLRPDELLTLTTVGQTLEQLGSPEAAIPYYERYVNFVNPNFGDIDQWGRYVSPDTIRVRLAGLVEEFGSPEEAVRLYRRALVHARSIDPLLVIPRLLALQIHLGRIGEAAQDLAAQVESLDAVALARAAGQAGTSRALQPVIVRVLNLLKQGQGAQAVALLTPLSAEATDPAPWLLTAIVARASSVELARAVLAQARQALPDDPSLASAQAELLR